MMNAPRAVPSGALTRIPQIKDANSALLSAFEAQQAFPQQQQARSGKVYFMYDFAARTATMFDSILNDAPATDTPATCGSVPRVKSSSMMEGQREELKNDAVGRCLMLHSMIMDTMGVTVLMLGEQPGRGIELGTAVENASQELMRIIEG